MGIATRQSGDKIVTAVTNADHGRSGMT